jgi:hypothetical protein
MITGTAVALPAPLVAADVALIDFSHMRCTSSG